MTQFDNMPACLTYIEHDIIIGAALVSGTRITVFNNFLVTNISTIKIYVGKKLIIESHPNRCKATQTGHKWDSISEILPFRINFVWKNL